jgi:RNA polymerase sigma-70 factor, ECF subfamily
VPDKRPKTNLASRLGAATDSAAAEVDEQFRSRLCQLVEREMNRRFRRREDPEDVVQSAFRTFYRRNAQGEFHIDSSGDLWRLLETITRHKILKHVEKLGAAKRNPNREEYPEGDNLPGKAPTPDEAAIAADLIENALAGLDESDVAVFSLRLASHTEEEIAARLNCTRALVHGKLERIRERLERLGLRGTPEDNRRSAELADFLRRCLQSSAGEYLGIDAPAGRSDEFGAGAPSEQAAKSIPVGELFRASHPPLVALIALKRRARRLMKPGASSLPVEVHRGVYFGSIATALVRHGRRISKSKPEVLKVAFEQLAAEAWIEDWFRGLLGDALRRLDL